MYIIMCNTRAKIKEYLKSLSNREIKDLVVVLVSDDVSKKSFSKDINVMEFGFLIPPPYICTQYSMNRNKEEFQDGYFEYLEIPECRCGIATIARLAYIDKKNVLLAFGEIEKEFHIDKYFKTFFNKVFPIKIFSFKDWKKDYREVIEYDPGDVTELIEDEFGHQINKIRESNSCKEPFNY